MISEIFRISTLSRDPCWAFIWQTFRISREVLFGSMFERIPCLRLNRFLWHEIANIHIFVSCLNDRVVCQSFSRWFRPPCASTWITPFMTGIYLSFPIQRAFLRRNYTRPRNRNNGEKEADVIRNAARRIAAGSITFESRPFVFYSRKSYLCRE